MENGSERGRNYNFEEYWSIMGSMEDKELEEEFDKISNLKWYPWVGEKYFSQEKKVLIVGESHYEAGDFKEKGYTIGVVKEWPIGNPLKQQMFAGLYRAICPNNDNKTKIWEYISFYNFVQQPMNGSQPNSSDFINGWKVFYELIDVLKPDYCLFVGVAASDMLNKAQKQFGLEKNDVKRIQLEQGKKRSKCARYFVINNTECVAIQHTSHHFSHQKWNEFLKKNSPDLMREFEKYCK